MRFLSSVLAVFIVTLLSTSDVSFKDAQNVKGAANCNVNLRIPFACGDPWEIEDEVYCESLNWERWYQVVGTQDHRIVDTDECAEYSATKCFGAALHDAVENSNFCTLDIIFF